MYYRTTTKYINKAKKAPNSTLKNLKSINSNI